MEMNEFVDMDPPNHDINQVLLDREDNKPLFHYKKELLIMTQDCPSHINCSDIIYQAQECQLGEENHHDLDHDLLLEQFIKTKNKELSEEPCGNSAISFS